MGDWIGPELRYHNARRDLERGVPLNPDPRSDPVGLLAHTAQLGPAVQFSRLSSPRVGTPRPLPSGSTSLNLRQPWHPHANGCQHKLLSTGNHGPHKRRKLEGLSGWRANLLSEYQDYAWDLRFPLTRATRSANQRRWAGVAQVKSARFVCGRSLVETAPGTKYGTP